MTVRVKPDFTLEGKVQTLPSLSPNSVLVPKTPPTVPPAGGVCAGGGQAEEVLAELNRITGMHFKARHPNGALTSNGRRVVAGLKNGYTADQLIRVVRLKCRAWMGGEMQKYLRPKTLFAPENFDQYVAGLRDDAPAVQTSGQVGPRQGVAEPAPVSEPLPSCARRESIAASASPC